MTLCKYLKNKGFSAYGACYLAYAIHDLHLFSNPVIIAKTCGRISATISVEWNANEQTATALRHLESKTFNQLF